MTDKVKEGTLVYKVNRQMERRNDSLPVLPTPPPGTFKSAFFTAIRYRSISSAIAAYNQAVDELANTHDAQARLQDSVLEHERAIRRFEDAHVVHEADAKARRAEAIAIKDNHDEVEHSSYLRNMQRERERIEAEREHQAFMAGKPPEKAKMTEEEREFAEFLASKAAPARFRQMAENRIIEYIRERGGVLSDEDRAFIESIREGCEEYIRDGS